MSGYGGLKIGMEVVARNPCPIHKLTHTQDDECQMGFVGKTYDEHDMGLYAFAASLIANVFNQSNTATSVPDTGNTSRSWAANSAVSALSLVAGSGVTGPTFPDYVIDTAIAGGSGTATPTVGTTITSLGSSGTFLITGTFTNSSGSNKTYGNVGIYVTANTYVFMLAHDQTNGASGYVVSNSGTVALTYTITVS